MNVSTEDIDAQEVIAPQLQRQGGLEAIESYNKFTENLKNDKEVFDVYGIEEEVIKIKKKHKKIESPVLSIGNEEEGNFLHREAPMEGGLPESYPPEDTREAISEIPEGFFQRVAADWEEAKEEVDLDFDKADKARAENAKESRERMKKIARESWGKTTDMLKATPEELMKSPAKVLRLAGKAGSWWAEKPVKRTALVGAGALAGYGTFWFLKTLAAPMFLGWMFWKEWKKKGK